MKSLTKLSLLLLLLNSCSYLQQATTQAVNQTGTTMVNTAIRKTQREIEDGFNKGIEKIAGKKEQVADSMQVKK